MSRKHKQDPEDKQSQVVSINPKKKKTEKTQYTMPNLGIHQPFRYGAAFPNNSKGTSCCSNFSVLININKRNNIGKSQQIIPLTNSKTF